jgi:cystathionine beta-lyase
VVIQPPVYPPFASSVRANGRTLIENPIVETPDGYRIDFDDLDRKLAGARLLLFCNPHNPTGRVLTRDELTKVGELCCKHNVLIISDEIHSDLVQKPYHHTHIARNFEAFCRSMGLTPIDVACNQSAQAITSSL